MRKRGGQRERGERGGRGDREGGGREGELRDKSNVRAAAK